MKKRSRRAKRRRKSRKSKTRRKRGGDPPSQLTSSDAKMWNAAQRAKTQTDHSSPTYRENRKRRENKRLTKAFNNEDGYDGRPLASGKILVLGGMKKKRKRKRKKRRTKKR